MQSYENTGYFFNSTVIFDRCHRSLAMSFNVSANEINNEHQIHNWIKKKVYIEMELPLYYLGCIHRYLTKKIPT